jgi:hypothetical protein
MLTAGMAWVALLSYAAYYHRFEVVELLLGRDDIKVNLADDEEKVPLYFACRSDCVTTVRLLLSHPDTDPNLVGTNFLVLVGSVGLRKSSLSCSMQVLGSEELEVLLVVRGKRGEKTLQPRYLLILIRKFMH